MDGESDLPDIMNVTGDAGCGAGQKGPDEEPKIIIHIAMGMVTLLSVCGILGNALAIFVFSRQKHKLSSTIFILTLAVTDFITSLVTMPYTVVMELMEYNINYDFPCKLYQFMKTTTIPFSAFVMVAIALDRYLCIVYPFKHIMTVRKAKITVFVLSMYAFVIGILASLMIGTYHKQTTRPGCTQTTTSSENIISYKDDADGNVTLHLDSVIGNINGSFATKMSDNMESSDPIVHSGVCKSSTLIFSIEFIHVYQIVYSALFGVCAVLVVILYGLTYRSVLAHRSKRLNLGNKCCGMFGSETENSNFDHTESTKLKKEDHSPINNGNEGKNGCIQLQEKYRDRAGTGESEPAVDHVKNDHAANKGGISRAKLKKLRVANIKTALMLSIVAFMYIVAFTPAWMMALNVLTMNVIVYYLYFTYNVANPVIYAFLNNNFRTHLQAMFRCK
ncbi:Neuropeptide FF receptor 2 [Mactra antiquata]